MRRYMAGLLVALFVITSMGIGLYSQPTIAQDQTEQRLSVLETQVAILERRVDALESGGGASTATPTSSESGILEVSGTASTVTEDFSLEAGRYQVTVDVASGCCVVLYIYGPSGTEDLLFSESFSNTTGGTASAIYQASESGMYFIESELTDGDWTVTFEKR